MKIRLAAPPVDGAANTELVRFLAELFDLPPSTIEIVRGHGSRDKAVHVPNVTVAVAKARLGI